MKFTIDLKVLNKLLRQVSNKMPHQKRSDLEFNLFACQARVFAECNETVAGAEALVFVDGFCRLNRSKLRRVLATFKGRNNLTIEADDGGLRIANFCMAVKSYSSHVKPPAKFQEFALNDLRVTGSEKTDVGEQIKNRGVTQQLEATTPIEQETKPDEEHLEAAPSSRFISDDANPFEGPYPILSYLSLRVEMFIRALFILEAVQPKMMIGLARAFYAFKRLPKSTNGVDVHFKICQRLELSVGYREVGHYVSFSEKLFEVGDYHYGNEGTWEKESRNPVYSLAWSWSEAVPEENDCEAENIVGWVERFDRLLMKRDGKAYIVKVEDKSEPWCIPPE